MKIPVVKWKCLIGFVALIAFGRHIHLYGGHALQKLQLSVVQLQVNVNVSLASSTLTSVGDEILSNNTTTNSTTNGTTTTTPPVASEDGLLKNDTSEKSTGEAESKSDEKSEAASTTSTSSSIPTDNHNWRPSRAWIEDCIANVTNDPTIMKPFQSLTKRYVLGDCVKMCSRCHLSSRGKAMKRLPRKLGNLYEDQACPQDNPNYRTGGNLDILWKVIQQWAPKQDNLIKPDNHTVVLHIRLGDVIEAAQDSVAKMLWRGGNPSHLGPFNNSIKPIKEYLNNFQQQESQQSTNTNTTKAIQQVVIVGGGFGDKNEFNRSRQYVTCLARGFQQAGYPVQLNVDSSHADADFYYMIHSNMFIPTVGGFSQLIAKMVTKLGGTVLGRTFESLADVDYWEHRYERRHGMTINRTIATPPDVAKALQLPSGQ